VPLPKRKDQRAAPLFVYYPIAIVVLDMGAGRMENSSSSPKACSLYSHVFVYIITI